MEKSILSRLSLEARILLCAARTQLDDKKKELLRNMLMNPINWDFLLALASRNRVMALLYYSLRNTCQDVVPGNIISRLREYYHLNSLRNHLLTEELLSFLGLLRDSGIVAIPLKGPFLTEHAYGRGALREFSDLDIIVKKEDIYRAIDCVNARGYHLKSPMTVAQDELHLSSGFEYELERDDGKVHIELRWELSERAVSYNMDYCGLWDRLSITSISGAEVVSLSKDDTLLYLCIHGSKHFWQRLLWVCDVSEFIRVSGDFDWEWIIKEAGKMGNKRMLLLGLHLAHYLLDANIPGHVLEMIEKDCEIGKFALYACDALFLQDFQPPGIIETHLLLYKLRERLRDRLLYVFHFVSTPNPRDAEFVKLPKPLFFLYYLIRPFRQLCKYIPITLGCNRKRK